MSNKLPDQLAGTLPSALHLLREAAAQRPNAIAVECDGVTLTYCELERCVKGFADQLRRMGGEGAVILVALENSIEIVVATYAVFAARAQLCPVNPRFTGRELGQIVDDAKPSVIITSAAAADTLEPLQHGANNFIRLGMNDENWLQVWRNDASQTLDAENLPDGSDLALLQYTGGTTGLPKGVNIAHRQMTINIAQREACLPTQLDDERILCVMPLYHVFATAMCMYLAVACRGALYILKEYKPDAVFESFARHRITIFPAGPTVFNGLLADEGFADADISSLRFSVSGASSLPLDVLTRWQGSTGTPIFEGYGQTEAGPVVSFNSPLFPARPGSVGRPIPHTEVEIVDPQNDTEVAPIGETGEIRVRGPQLMKDYRNRPEETASALRAGWLYTGDLGCLDDDGYLFIRGRKKEMIIVSGFNVYPREIDEVLASHPDVAEAATVGAVDERRGEAPYAFVVLNDGAAISEKELSGYCRENLTAYKVPVRILVFDTLPRTAVGKVDIVTLQDRAAKI